MKNWLASAIVITTAGLPATTYSEDAPRLVQQIAQAQGAKRIDCVQRPLPRFDSEYDYDFCRYERDSRDLRPVPYG